MQMAADATSPDDPGIAGVALRAGRRSAIFRSDACADAEREYGARALHLRRPSARRRRSRAGRCGARTNSPRALDRYRTADGAARRRRSSRRASARSRRGSVNAAAAAQALRARRERLALRHAGADAARAPARHARPRARRRSPRPSAPPPSGATSSPWTRSPGRPSKPGTVGRGAAASAQALRTGTRDRAILYHAAAIAAAAGDHAARPRSRVASARRPSRVRSAARPRRRARCSRCLN